MRILHACIFVERNIRTGMNEWITNTFPKVLYSNIHMNVNRLYKKRRSKENLTYLTQSTFLVEFKFLNKDILFLVLRMEL